MADGCTQTQCPASIPPEGMVNPGVEFVRTAEWSNDPVAEDIARAALEFVLQMLRTSPGHLETGAGQALLAALGLIRQEANDE